MSALSPVTLVCTMLCNYKLLLLRTDGGYNLIITRLHLQVTSKLIFTSHNTMAYMILLVLICNAKILGQLLWSFVYTTL